MYDCHWVNLGYAWVLSCDFPNSMWSVSIGQINVTLQRCAHWFVLYNWNVLCCVVDWILAGLRVHRDRSQLEIKLTSGTGEIMLDWSYGSDCGMEELVLSVICPAHGVGDLCHNIYINSFVIIWMCQEINNYVIANHGVMFMLLWTIAMWVLWFTHGKMNHTLDQREHR